MREIAEQIEADIRALQKTHSRLLVAIDGRCAAGKTTLAEALRVRMDCNVLHMDAFFLRPEQRTAERLAAPGGNVDYERFLEEALLPLAAGKAFSYRPWICREGALGEPIAVTPKAVTIVEGSYSCHPVLTDYYDYRIFLSVAPEEQLRRIRIRNGSACAVRFQTTWIPLEETYFAAYAIANTCNARYDTGIARACETEK